VTLWIHGLHAVQEALAARPENVRRVVAAAGRDDERLRRLIETARRNGVPVERQPPREIERLVGREATHQGVVALLTGTDDRDPEGVIRSARSPALFVVLDGVEDPRNLGAVIRSAAAAGADGLFLPEHRAAPLSAASLKASAGTALRFPVARVGNVVSFLKRLKDEGIWVVGLDLTGEPIWGGFDLTLPLALVVGVEGKGLRRLARKHCDVLLSIPVSPEVPSLNLAVAAGVALFETLRQRRAKTS
jgi:23S rRNA (guanosine2251-2'-O)-methyltransferase